MSRPLYTNIVTSDPSIGVSMPDASFVLSTLNRPLLLHFDARNGPSYKATCRNEYQHPGTSQLPKWWDWYNQRLASQNDVVVVVFFTWLVKWRTLPTQILYITGVKLKEPEQFDQPFLCIQNYFLSTSIPPDFVFNLIGPHLFASYIGFWDMRLIDIAFNSPYMHMWFSNFPKKSLALFTPLRGRVRPHQGHKVS